jgi:hypothetical protein
VLSQSTRAIDKREKLEACRRLPSRRTYAQIEPAIRKVDVATFSGSDREVSSEVDGPGCVVNLEYVMLDVDAFYDVTDNDATT